MEKLLLYIATIQTFMLIMLFKGNCDIKSTIEKTHKKHIDK